MHLIAITVGMLVTIKLLQLWLRHASLSAEQLYLCPYTGKLYRYSAYMNVQGHRSARQDWWQEVRPTGFGRVKTVGGWQKHNVGYNPRPGQIWCHPYKPLSVMEVRELDREVRKQRFALATVTS